MKKIAIYTNAMTPELAARVEGVLKNGGVAAYRSARHFKASEKESFDAALVDGKAPNAEAIAEAMRAWGIKEVEVLAPAKDDGAKKAKDKDAVKVAAPAKDDGARASAA